MTRAAKREVAPPRTSQSALLRCGAMVEERTTALAQLQSNDPGNSRGVQDIKARFDKSVSKLVSMYDTHMEGLVVDRLLLPVHLTVAVARRPLSFEASFRANTSLADVRAFLETTLQEIGYPVVAYGEDSHFIAQSLLRPQQRPASSTGTFGFLFRTRPALATIELGKPMKFCRDREDSTFLADLDIGLHPRLTLEGGVTLRHVGMLAAKDQHAVNDNNEQANNKDHHDNGPGFGSIDTDTDTDTDTDNDTDTDTDNDDVDGSDP